MIRVDNLCKSYGSQLLFDGVSFSLQSGERLGIVGRNGHGKSTLFKIIIGEEHQDSGEIYIPRNYRIGHLSQHLHFNHPTILEEVVSALPELEGGWREEYKAEAVLQGLGFHQEDFSRSPAEFSGGFQIRLNLAKLLLTEPNLLLLDEPTNYLDIVAVRWLSRFLREEWGGEMMLITHDREFMDSVTTHTMAIHRQKAKKLEGGTEKLYSQILQEEEIYEKTRLNQEKQRKEIERFITRFRAKASKATLVQSRVKRLEKMEVRGELAEIDSLDFRFTPAPFPGKFMAELVDVGFGYSEVKLFDGVTVSVAKEDRIGIIGPNGKGKTTLLSLIAGDLKPRSGSIALNPNTRLSYFGQTNVNRLPLDTTIEEEFVNTHEQHNRTVARTIAGLMMFEGDFALKKIRYLSGGERSRVLLGKILLTPSNMLLLDEPTNHLDMESIEALLEAVDEFPGAVMIVTHSEEILRRVANRLIVFDRGEVTLFEGTYDEFLERIGWSDEDEDPSIVKRRKKRDDADALRAKNAELKKREKQILQLEAEQNELNEQLAAGGRSSSDIRKLSERLTEVNSRIETLFQEMISLQGGG